MTNITFLAVSSIITIVIGVASSLISMAKENKKITAEITEKDSSIKLSDDEFEEIKKAFEPVGIAVDRPINKAEWAQDVLHFVFSDFSAVSYIRDGLLTLAQAEVLKRVWAYYKKKNRENIYPMINREFAKV